MMGVAPVRLTQVCSLPASSRKEMLVRGANVRFCWPSTMLSARPSIIVSFQTWFNRQPVAARLLILLPALALALYWSASLSEPQRPGSASSNNRPVLSREETAADTRTQATTNSTSQPAAQPTLAPHVEPRRADADLSWSTLLRTIVSVLVVIGLVLLSARVLKYIVANTTQVTGSESSIKVMETTFVPAPSGRGRSAMHLVQVGDRLLLVGATDANLSLLAEFERDDQSVRQTAPATHAVVASNGSVTSEPPAFAQVLQAAHAEPVVTPNTVIGSDHAPVHVDRDLEQVMERLRESRRRLEG